MPKTTSRPTPGAALRTSALATGLLALLAQGALAQNADLAALAAKQSVANAGAGPREVPRRAVPVPTEGATPEAQALIAAPYSPFWNAAGTTLEEWRAFKAQSDAATEPLLAALRESLGDAVRVQRKLRRAGVVAELQMFEGFSHAQYLFDPPAPETLEMSKEIAAFFDAHLAG